MWPVNLLPDASTRRRQQRRRRCAPITAGRFVVAPPLAVGHAWGLLAVTNNSKLAEEREDAVQALEAIAGRVLVQQLDARRRELQALIQQNSTPLWLLPNLVTSLITAVTARQLSVSRASSPSRARLP